MHLNQIMAQKKNGEHTSLLSLAPSFWPIDAFVLYSMVMKNQASLNLTLNCRLSKKQMDYVIIISLIDKQSRRKTIVRNIVLIKLSTI